MEERVLTASELGNIIKRIFVSEEMLHDILVSGEVSNLKISGNHVYFNLKDEDATLYATFFGGARQSGLPKNGDKVLVRGSVDFYVKGGSLNLKVTKVSPLGLGALYLKFLELKDKLEKEGIFDEKHKKPIPTHIKNLGVVTSETGAVIRDIINVTKRRNPMVNIILFPVKVQGENADSSIARGVQLLDEMGKCDVIIVGRGGGSLEDLQGFNSEKVAKAVFHSRTPIISAVGHETDFSLCDFASDMRAPTPSAGAELAVYDLVTHAKIFIQKSKTLGQLALSGLLKKQTSAVSRGNSLKLYGINAVQKVENNLNNSTAKLLDKIRNQYKSKRDTLSTLSGKIDLLSPLKTMSKGFTKVSFQGKTVKSVDTLKIGDVLTMNLLDGKIESEIVTLCKNQQIKEI